jgi:hypothetical protein
LRTWQGFGSKHTLQTLHNIKQMPSAMLRTTRPASRNSCGVRSTGDRINMPIEIAFCTGSSGSWVWVILLLRTVHFEMGLQFIAAREGPRTAITRAGKFTIDRSIDDNLTGGSADLTSRSMHRSAMPVTLTRSGKRNVALGALEVSHGCRSTTRI